MMKLRFKHQKFQADAAKAVVNVFAGQPYLAHSYMMDKGYEGNLITGGTFSNISMFDEEQYTGWGNQKIISGLSDDIILNHIQKIQRTNKIKPSEKLEGK